MFMTILTQTPRALLALLLAALALTGLTLALAAPLTAEEQLRRFNASPLAADAALIHYWLFDGQMDNNTPLTAVAGTYSSVILPDGQIEFQSALNDYPFDNTHLNWRKASMERRNAPTLINYRPEGNEDIPFADADMRGLQIKQPFTDDDSQNALIFHLPTTGYQNVVFQFAAMDEGAADSLVFAYSTSAGQPDWRADSIVEIAPLTAAFQLYMIDFAGIEAVNDNPDFKIRIRFTGADMSADIGARVTFNNFSLDAVPLPDTNFPPVLIAPVDLQRLIVGGDPVVLDLADLFADPNEDPLTFTAVTDNPAVQLTLTHNILTLTGFYQGEALIALTAADAFHPPTETSFRALVYPAAYSLSDAPFLFAEWDADTPERIYPAHMLFLQSDQDDTELDAALDYAYHIPHDDYHPDDGDTIGYPYNNTRRARINGLGEDGLAFINTGGGRDLGGALVALDTRGVDEPIINWLGGTMLPNERVYAIRLQYRLDIHAPFADLLVAGEPVEYVANALDHTQFLREIPMPDDALERPYVQLLWRYYHVDGDSGPRAQLRLDDILIGASAAINLPPVVVDLAPWQYLIAGGDSIVIDLAELFIDREGDPLTFTAVADNPLAVQLTHLHNTITLTGLYQGDAVIALTADDGVNPPAAADFRLLVYPAAHSLRDAPFAFNEWNADTPERVYPAHILFLQSDVVETKLDTDLLYAYHLLPGDYGDPDSDTIGYPYNNVSRTRINGLGANGVSFVNTGVNPGRDRGLGGLLLALDTREADDMTINWLSGTILQHGRVYAMRLQYRLALDAPFADVLVGGQPVEYRVGADGNLRFFANIPLPAEALNQPYVQLLWRYYHIEGELGSRAQLRLDDIRIGEPLPQIFLPLISN